MSTYVTANTSKTPTTPLTAPMNAPIITWRKDDVPWPGEGAVAVALAIALDYNPDAQVTGAVPCILVYQACSCRTGKRVWCGNIPGFYATVPLDEPGTNHSPLGSAHVCRKMLTGSQRLSARILCGKSHRIEVQCPPT